MNRIKNILLVADEKDSGQETLTRAVDLATRNQAKLTLIKVISQVPDDYRVFITSLLPEEIMALAIKENTQLLEKQIASFENSIKIELKVVVGREFIEIIREVLREKHDLVMKSARGMGGRVGVLFGTTAMHLLRKCPCPVWLIRPEQDRSYGQIMAAVDVDPAMNEDNALNQKIMQMATSLAQIENSKLHVVYSWKRLDLIYLTGEFDYVPPPAFAKASEEMKDMHTKWLADFLEQYKDQQFQEHLVEGSAGVALPAFAEDHKIDLIVMGTVCRTGIPGFFIGNTAEKILNRIDCSVLAVKPDGFVSPVQLDDQ